MNKIEIPKSKTKLLLGIGASLIFVVVGVYFFTTADHQTHFNPYEIKVTGITAVVFFGATCTYGIKKLSDKTIGIAIDDDGIFDNSNASSIGLIKWSDITAIKTESVRTTKFLLIYTTNPCHYLDKAKGFKRMLMAGNNRIYGTPLSITSNTLKCDFDELEMQIRERHQVKRKMVSTG